MTLTVAGWELAALYEQQGGVQERVWKLLAYLGRYGHQPMGQMRGYPVRELVLLAGEVSELVRFENGPTEHRGE